MSIGKLRERLTLESQALDADATLGAVATWTVIDSVWGDIKPLHHREGLAPGQGDGAITHNITIRYDPTLLIQTGQRVVWGTRTFRVRGIGNPDERKRWIALSVEEETV